MGNTGHAPSPFKRPVLVAGVPPPPSTPQQWRASTYDSPLQRKVAFASPHVSTPKDEMEEEQRTSWHEWYEQLPIILVERLQSLWMDIESLIHKPEMGVPIGVVMHAASLLSQLLLPGTSFLNTRESMHRHARSKLFAPRSRFANAHDSHTYSAYIGRLVMQRRTAMLVYMSRLLSLFLLVLATYNAYLLFSKRRTYRLWYRDERDVLNNPHAKLEAPPRDSPPRRTWQAWAKHMAHTAARQIPIVEWFVPPPPVRIISEPTERIYTLRVWDIYDAPLRLFTYVGFFSLTIQNLFASPCRVVGDRRLGGYECMGQLACDVYRHGDVFRTSIPPRA